MKKKIIIVLFLLFLVLTLLLLLDVRLGLYLLYLYVAASVVLIALLGANKLLKVSNWYKNQFIHCDQLNTGNKYRLDRQRNYEIVNLGSNSALFSFFYGNINGRNWSTGSQGPDVDLSILQLYHSYIKEGGIVLIPIVPFSSCTTYLERYKPNYVSFENYGRFTYALLDGGALFSKTLPYWNKARFWLKYPLFVQPSAVVRLFHDVPPDTRHLISEQPMPYMMLKNDAEMWMRNWKEEFDIIDFDSPLNDVMLKCHEECSKKFAEIIDFCKERNLRPVLIIPPVSKVLSDCFSEKARNIYMYSFVNKIQTHSRADFLDYFEDESFQNPELYFNSFYLNLKGRKLFTDKVVADLNLG